MTDPTRDQTRDLGRGQPESFGRGFEEDAFTMDVRNRLMWEVRTDPIFQRREFEDHYTFMRRMEYTYLRARELHDSARDTWLMRRQLSTGFRQREAEESEFPSETRGTPRYSFSPLFTPREGEERTQPTFSPRVVPTGGYESSPSPEYTPWNDLRWDAYVAGCSDRERSRSPTRTEEVGEPEEHPPEVEICVDERSIAANYDSSRLPSEDRDPESDPEESDPEDEHMPEAEPEGGQTDGETDMEDSEGDPEEDPEEGPEPAEDLAGDPDYVDSP